MIFQQAAACFSLFRGTMMFMDPVIHAYGIKLSPVEFTVKAGMADQFFMGALLCHTSVSHDQNEVRIFDG